ncbi:MAG: nickel pincer cofactor biosynthesis protein LarB [Anaerolineae bacterium]
MDDRLKTLLEDVKAGRLETDEALALLRDLPYQDLGYALLDHHRGLRKGFPEVVFCQGKTPSQVAELLSELSRRHDHVMATRANEETCRAVQEAIPEATYHAQARIIVVDAASGEPRPETEDRGYVLVISAGTSDIPVAEEAAVTLEVLGSPVQRLYDVGVAGLHRLLDRRESLFKAKVIIAVAGMEGALASVVGGLVSCPVIAVPTSVGYGASFNGLAPLLTMLNCCAPGVAVVNVDNGFGAGYFAHTIMDLAGER